jgi:hypothetical protein
LLHDVSTTAKVPTKFHGSKRLVFTNVLVLKIQIHESPGIEDRAFLFMTIENIIGTIRYQLKEVKSMLLKWIQEDAKVLHYKPRDGGWNSVQILEHITLTNHFLLVIIDKASSKAKHRASSNKVQQDWENYEMVPKQLEDVGVHKSFAWRRPEHMEPHGDISLGEIERRMIKQLDRCDLHLDFLKHGEGTLCKTTMSVNSIGKLDVYQYIYFIILHAKRHLTQLERNKVEYELENGSN